MWGRHFGSLIKSTPMRTSDFDYKLPNELIAQRPPEKRGGSRMMVIDRKSGEISHQRFLDFPNFINSDDRLVLNDTRVVAARYFSNDGRKEILRLDLLGPKRWKCLVRPGKKFRIGQTIEIGNGTGTVVEICEEGGERIIDFDRTPDERAHGHLALPPTLIDLTRRTIRRATKRFTLGRRERSQRRQPAFIFPMKCWRPCLTVL